MKKTAAFVLSFLGLGFSTSPEKTMLPVGTLAPDFSLSTQSGDTVSLSSLRTNSAVVLVFYPGDATPVCTRQLCALRDDFQAFTLLNAKVFGINPGSASSHVDFSTTHKFPFPLLVDNKKVVTKLYGCDGLVMIQRTVYVINSSGKIIFAQRGNPPVSEILKVISDK